MKYNGSDKWKQEATKKLNRIPENIIKDVKVNDESVVDEEGIANIAVPVSITDLNDADQYVLKAALKEYYKKDETYSKEEVNNLVDMIPKFAIEVVTTLPTTKISTTTIYLIKTSETETGNLYTEYIYVNDSWEILGIQKLDLTNYYTKQEVDNLIKGIRDETQEALSNLDESLNSHIGDSIKHITSEERTNWDSAKTHADSVHARTDATKVEKSTTNGNIKINGNETIVYTHPSGTNPHGTSKSDVGLGNVGNFKAVSTVASQGLTDTEKANARANIGAGTSSLGLGETSSTAYRGDRGKTAYDHSQTAHAPSNAQANVIETVKVNGTALTPSSKSVDVTVPTKVSQLANDSGYKTTDTNTWRPVENVLTSDSTTNSLSAAQGKVLKGLIDGKAASSHTHNYLPLSGGTMNGSIKYTSNSLPSKTLSFICGIDAFADGGEMGWQSKEEFLSDYSKTSHTHNYLPLSGGTVTGNIIAPRLIGKADSLQGQFIEGALYVTDDTHILQLGYWNCTGAYDRATLLISSSFWGNQHGSADIIHISQDTNTNSATTVQCTLCRTKLHIKGTDREFYYKIDNTNKRIYLYAKVIGGNGYGKWSICPILFEGGTWTTEAKSNQPTTDLIAIRQLYASSSVDGSANSSNTLINNPVMNYGWNGVNYFNINGTAGNAAKVNDTPTTKWWHIMRFNHANSTGYYTDLAIPFNDVSLYYKRITSGSVQNNGWIKVLDSLNYNSYCLPLSGGTMTGQINKAGVGSSWVQGRDNAMARMTSINEYSPFASIKTTNGSWEIGAYNHSQYYDNLIFSYVTDSDYNASNNKAVSQIRFYNNGLIEGRARLIGSYTSTATERYRQGGLEIRENNSVGNTQSDIGYAPSIGFHWSGRCAGTLCLDKDAIFHFLKQDGTRATLDANLNGNAYSSTYASTASKVAPIVADSTNEAENFYHMPFLIRTASTATLNDVMLYNNGITYRTLAGTVSANGYGTLVLGNSTASGNAGNKYGKLTIFGTSTGNTSLVSSNVTSDITITLPSSSGTLSLNGHTHNYAGSSSAGGTANSANALANRYTNSSRPTTADASHVENGGVRHFKATSSMTTSKPVSDGHILHFDWDSSQAYDSQLFISNGDGAIGTRRKDGSTNTWSGWRYAILSFSDSTYKKVKQLLMFGDSNNALITGDKGNFIWAVSSWSDRKLKKNIKDADVSALDKINQIQFKEFDFIDDKKFGKHQELGYIADELKEVFPECVVTVPQDKEKFGYEELDQVQDVGLIKYLAKSIQELSSIINEQNKKINTLQKEVDKLKRKN